MADPYNYNQSQYADSVFSNIFAQGLAAPLISQGRAMGSVGEGPPLAGLLGISDPGMSVALNTILQPILTSFIGGKYTPAQFSSGMNMYSQMRAGSVLGGQNRAMGMASQKDQRAIYEMIEGSANLMGQPMGRRERQGANEVASFVASALPTLAQMNPDLVDKMGGVRGSATVMAQNMYRGGRYAIDPVTGRRGYSAESAAEITKGVYDRLYSGDPSAMGGMTAGRAGALFDDLQRRGMMPNTSNRGRGMKEIADQMGTTINEVSQMPDLDRKLRELDANKIADKLKGMSKAVNAMSEIFGEAGEPNAPMSQLVGAIETLTQANMQNMEPHKLERMVRNTSNVAKAAGIEMPEMFKLMGSTAGMADRAGVNRVFVPGITNQAVAENQAGKNIFGGAQVFGLPSADKLLNIDQQLNVQAAKDYRTQDIASIARAVETFGVAPEKGSELAAVYDAIKNKDSGGKYTYNGETRNVYDLNKRDGGVSGFLSGNKVPMSVIQSLNANREANEAFINKYDINTNIGRQGQTRLVGDEMTMYNGLAMRSVMADKGVMENVSPELKAMLDSSALDITKQVSEGMFSENLTKDDLNDLRGLTERNLVKAFEDKGVKLTESDRSALKVMAGSLYESSDAYARSQQFEGGLPTMAYSMNKGKINEARALQADADITSQFEEGFGGMGKSSFLQRATDFLRGAGPNTSVEDFMASALNYQPTEQIKEMFAKDFDNLQKSAEAFKGASGQAVKEDYLRNAITVNADAIDKEGDPEKKKELIAEQNRLKEDLVQSGFTDRSTVNEYYDKMIDKNPGAVATATKNLAEFENKHSVSVDTAKTMNPLDIQVRQRSALLNKYRELADLTNTRVNNSGLMVGEVSGNKSVNEAVKYLGKGTAGDSSYGVSLAKKFLSEFGMDSASVSKAGVEGNQAKEKAQSGIIRLEAYAKALGVEPGDMLSGDFDAGGLPPQISLEALQNETGENLAGLQTLYDRRADPDEFSRVISTFKSKADALRSEKDDPKATEAEKRAKARKISRLDELAKTTKDNLSTKLTDAKKTAEELKGEPLKALESAFDGFRQAYEAQVEHSDAVSTFLKDINDRPGVFKNLTLAQIAAPKEDDLKKVRDLREEKSKLGTSKEDMVRREKIDKEIKETMGDLDESKFKGLAGEDYEGAIKLIQKYRPLDGEGEKKLARLSNIVSSVSNLSAEEQHELDNLNKGIGPLKSDQDKKDALELDQLQTLKSRQENKGKAIELSKTDENEDKLSYLLSKYKSAYDLVHPHSDGALSNAGKEKQAERETMLELAGIKDTDRERQNRKLEMLFDKHKAAEAGIKYGESFVIKDGKAVPATDADVESGNFSYINKTGDKTTQGNVKHFGTRPEKGAYDKFKNTETGPLTPEQEKRREALLGKQESRRSELMAKKEKAEKALTEPQRKEYEELLARRDQKLSPEDRKRLDTYAAKANMTVSELKDLENWKANNDKIMAGLSAEDKTEANRLLKEGKVLDAQQITATAKMGGFSPQAVMALMGAGKSEKGKPSYFSLLMQSEQKNLMGSLKDLGIATTLGGPTKMSASQEEAVVNAAKLEGGTTQAAVKFYSEDLKLPGMKGAAAGKAGALQAEVFANEAAARQVGKDLTLGMEAAGRYAATPGSKTKLSREQQLKALGDLLAGPDDAKLSDEQKTLKKGLLDKGFKDVVDKGGNVNEAKLIELFKKTQVAVAEKDALNQDKGREASVTKVSFKDATVKFEGTLDVNSRVLAGNGTMNAGVSGA